MVSGKHFSKRRKLLGQSRARQNPLWLVHLLLPIGTIMPRGSRLCAGHKIAERHIYRMGRWLLLSRPIRHEPSRSLGIAGPSRATHMDHDDQKPNANDRL